MNTSHEQNILTFSACGALFFAVLALIWGLLARSQMIMFDGIYSFISLVLTGLYFYAAKSIAIGSDEKFPFGRAQLEPMVIVVQSIVLLLICAKAFKNAVTSLFSGGQQVNNLSAMAYAAIGAAGCFISWLYITRTRKKKAPQSELIKSQGSQWLMDTLLSLAVLIGFFIGYIIERAGYADYARYIDSLMVIVVVLFFVREPIVSLITGIKGILIMGADKNIYHSSEEIIKEIAANTGFEDFILRIGKSGRKLVYEVSFVAKDPDNSRSISELDEIHRQVQDRLYNLCDNPLWLHVSFVHDKNLA